MNAHDAKMKRWRHYSFFGHVKMMEKNLQTIIDADSTTLSAKEKARNLLTRLPALYEALQERVE